MNDATRIDAASQQLTTQNELVDEATDTLALRMALAYPEGLGPWRETVAAGRALQDGKPTERAKEKCGKK